MDVESKVTHQENDVKHNEDSTQNGTSNAETNGSTKESPTKNSRHKRGTARSRSRTPQKKTEETKTLHVTLKKFDNEVNGKEETGKTEQTENDNKVVTDEVNEEKPVTEDKGNVEQETNKEKKIQKPKDEKSKKDESKKLSTPEKKEATKKLEKEATKKLEKEVTKKLEKEATKKTEKEATKKIEKEATKKLESKKESHKKEKKDKAKTEVVNQKNEPEGESVVEMDPLVISDEPDPELQFDENSDIESGKGSPILPRCVTRRSQTRNIPTPKTPKSVDQEIDSEKTSVTHTPTADVDNDVDLPKTDNLNDSCESMDSLNLSTNVEVGSDATRLDYIDHHNSNFEDSSYINASREKSLSETLRGLSARRSIRPLNDYRTRVLRSNQERSDLNLTYPLRDPVEQVTTGIKRKNRSITPEDTKKFKSDSPGSNSIFSSSFANLRNKFKSDLPPSSTPRLLSYRDTRSQLRYHDDDNFDHGDDEKKSWCSIM